MMLIIAACSLDIKSSKCTLCMFKLEKTAVTRSVHGAHYLHCCGHCGVSTQQEIRVSYYNHVAQTKTVTWTFHFINSPYMTQVTRNGYKPFVCEAQR